MNTIKCPYCGFENPPDCECLEEDADCEIECLNCEKIFMYTIGYIPVYSSWETPCLNGGKHKFKKTHTYPKEFARLRCKYCGEEKEIS